MIGSIRKHAFGEPAPTTKKPRVYRETSAQKRVVADLRKDPNWMVLRLENAQQRTEAAAARDKAMGMHKGAPDLIVIYKRNLAWLEMKAKTTTSDAQNQCHFELRARGQIVIVGRGYNEAMAKLAAFAAMCDNTESGATLPP
jgi:hypothetical protein